MKTATADDRPAGRPNELHSSKKRLRILYADDFAGLRELARAALTAEGYVVECVADGGEAIEKIGANPDCFDLVITDHDMPGKNGLALVGWLRTLPFPGKILVITSELNPAIGEAYRKLHVDGIVYKPAWPAELRQVVAQLAA